MLLKLFSAAGAALAVAGAFAFAAPQVAQAATTDPSYYLCPVRTFNYGYPIHFQPCYSFSPWNPGYGTVLQRLAVRTTLEAWNHKTQRFEARWSWGWWYQYAQSGAAGFENNTEWVDQKGQSQSGLQCYWLNWADVHLGGDFDDYWLLRVEFAWGAPFTYTSPVPLEYVGSATLYQVIGPL